MKLNKMTAVLLAATMLTGVSTPALAASKKSSGAEMRAIVDRQQKQIDALTAEIQAIRANAVPVAGALAGGVVANSDVADENASNIQFMQATVEAQQAQIDGLKKQVASNAPTWKGTPELKSDNGFSFKPSGEIQYDFGYVSNPNNSINNSLLGWNSIARRLLIGASGTLPGGFKYKAEYNFAGGSVGYEDVTLSYSPAGSPLEAVVGYYYPPTNMDNLASNKNISFSERAAFVDAFGEGRRLGGGLNYVTPTWLLQAGLFNGQLNSNSNNTDWQVAARGAFYPQALGGQLHFAGSYQNRTTLKSGQQNNYQARPYTQVTSVRFVGTGNIAVAGDQIIGLEAAGVWGPLHVASEAQWDKARAIAPTDILVGGNATTGQRLAADPTFFSVYGEVGYWLTGETRGYSKGTWATTKIVHPFDKGGWGGLQLVGRVDYINLTSDVGGPTAGPVINGTLNGGKQTGYQLALNWWPTEYVRFIMQYNHAQVTGGPNALAVVPDNTSTDLLYDRRYGVNALTMRAQLSF